MRQALFAVVLVAASFAGGAVVNGPGLRWAQSMAFGRLGLDDEGDHDAGASVGKGSRPDEIPSRPIPPLIVEPSIVSADGAKKADAPKPEAPTAKSDDVIKPASASPTPAPEPPPSDPGGLPGLAPVPEALAQVPPPVDPPAPLTTSRDRERAAIDLAAATATPPADRGPAKVPDDSKGQKAQNNKSIRPVSLADEVAVPATAPEPVPPASSPAPTASSDPADWAGVRKALRDLGVSRYGVEGEPGGRARFHCVIPLAGRRAVGQHFEAEGDDELQAARAVLRRVALWRATEAPDRTP